MNARRAALAAFIMAVGAAPASAQRLNMDQVLTVMDANGDGALARSEAEAARARMFDRLDSDGDGALSQAERDAARGARNGAEAITGGDANGDGFVSRAEAMARPYRIFDRFDGNRDDVLSAAELNAIRALRPGG